MSDFKTVSVELVKGRMDVRPSFVYIELLILYLRVVCHVSCCSCIRSFQSVNDVVIVATELVNRQVVHCHRVLRSVQTVAEKSTTINSKTWDALLRFLLAVNDVLLAPPTEKGLHFTVSSIVVLWGILQCTTLRGMIETALAVILIL